MFKFFSKPPPDLSGDMPTNQTLAEFRAKYDHEDGFSPAVNILSSETNPHILCSRKFLRLRTGLLLNLQEQINNLEKRMLSQNLKPEDKPTWGEIQIKLKAYDEVFHQLQQYALLPDPETENPLQLLHYVSTAEHAKTAFRRTILPVANDIGDGSEGYHDLYFFHQNGALTPWEHLENFYLEYFTNTPEHKLHPRKKRGEALDQVMNAIGASVLLGCIAVGTINGGLVETKNEKLVVGVGCVLLHQIGLILGTDLKPLAVLVAGLTFAFLVWIGVVLTAVNTGVCV